MQDFSGAKVGDKVWSIRDGDCTIREIRPMKGSRFRETERNFIFAGTSCYDFNGKCRAGDISPSLFWSNPNIIAPEKPKKEVRRMIDVTPDQYAYIINAIPKQFWNTPLYDICIHFSTKE